MGYVLVYDSDCGPCTRFRDVVGRLDVRRRIRYVGLDEADRAGLLNPVSPGRRMTSFHLVSDNGEVLSGARALPKLSSLLPGGVPLSIMLTRSPAVFSAASFVYTVFSRLHGSGSCSYTPGEGSLREPPDALASGTPLEGPGPAIRTP